MGNCGVWEGFCYPCMEITRNEKAAVWYKVDRREEEEEEEDVEKEKEKDSSSKEEEEEE